MDTYTGTMAKKVIYVLKKHCVQMCTTVMDINLESGQIIRVILS